MANEFLGKLIHYAISSPLGIVGSVIVLVLAIKFFPGLLRFIIVAVVVSFLLFMFLNYITDKARSALLPDWLQNLKPKIEWSLPTPTDLACGAGGVGMICDLFGGSKEATAQQKADEDTIEEICKNSQAIGSEDYFAQQYCNGNTFTRLRKTLDKAARGAVQGAVDAAPGPVVLKADPLETDQYLNCLRDQVMSRPSDVNAASCNAYKDAHKWRLCVEFHLQMPADLKASTASRYVSAPLDAGIQACRARASK